MRYVVVGLGNIGKRRQGLLGDRCVATVDPINPTADCKELAEIPGAAYDAAVVATPNVVKLALLRELLSTGKHVLVEKPLIFSGPEEADALASLADKNGAIWYTAYNHRFEPAIVELKKRIEAGTLGEFYHGRFLYGNGTVQNIAGTWRDGGFGVIEDLGCHLIDLAEFLFDVSTPDYRLLESSANESAAVDHCVFTDRGGRLVFECATTMWKNAFSIDVFGSRGSLHLAGLRKWGEAELIARERVFPSGVPIEERWSDSGPDNSWADDFREFESRVGRRVNSRRTDSLVSEAVKRLGRSDQSGSR